MTDKWPILKNPPVILAVMEISFHLKSDIDVSHLRKNDAPLLLKYPNRSDNFQGDINLPIPSAGISTAQISSKQVGFTYANADKTRKIGITQEHIVFAIERIYPGWNDFKQEGLDIVMHFNHILTESLINRVSVRFINRININNLTTPEEYFNTTISAREGTILNPIESYFLKYTMLIPNSKIKCNVIQSLEEKTENNCSFVLDIDVLCHEQIGFENLNLPNKLEEIREIKNTIFFKNITKKTLDQL